jgi:tetratricopeptide (TPR) repeat protein
MWLLIVGFVCGGNALAYESIKSVDERKNEVIITGLDLLYADKYREAIEHFKKLDEIDPDSSEGIFMQAFAMESYMDRYRIRDPELEEKLSIALKRAIEKAEKVTGIDPTARNHMFWGGAYGVRGIRQGKLGHWWNTFVDSINSIRYMRMAVAIDPELYDCYYGIGSYNYWVSDKLGKYLPFFDRRKEGIEQLKSTEKGIFARMSGKLALFRIYITEKRYDEIFESAKEIFREYPGSLVGRWQYGLALIRTKQWEKAIKHYQGILELLEPVKIKGPEASIEAWYYLGFSYYSVGEYQKAKELLVKILPYEGEVNEILFFHENCMKKNRKLLKKVNKALDRNL